MKRIQKYILLLLFLLGSFYSTNQWMIMMQSEDSIMKEIDKNSNKYYKEAEDAVITDTTIIPGKKGQTVDKQKSYQKMKQYGVYNETMTVLKEVEPKTSITTYYDKYIEKGNNAYRRVALVFPIKNIKTLQRAITILNREKVTATFFIDGNDIDSLISLIKKESNYEYELLSFQNEYNPSYMKTAESYLENITKKETNYCYSEINNQKLLNDCKKNKHHIIKPKVVLSEDITYEVKKNLENGLIISIHLNDNTLEELSTMIQAIKKKGYQFETLNELLKE